ncbi:hypothetical protein PGT21_002134 [Puccinia graminis f. sp. tritici]|uniref:Uncharacterized protein n=1 Tax=Puccinia graminis f. sp. tritici TaxID=56615 RepID=A0A5B0MB51_PUCGR|nr:hypothetical protein PGT21_002134 [Puccinia graminis f. sp. tritici]
MFLMNFFQTKHIGLALLPMISLLHSGQVGLADGREVNCKLHFESDDSKADAACWSDENTKFTCPKTSCRSVKYPERHFGQLVYLHCLNEDAAKYDVQVHPRSYHHYPKGDPKWNFVPTGFVAAFDNVSHLWYNCLYDSKKNNQDTYSQSL